MQRRKAMRQRASARPRPTRQQPAPLKPMTAAEMLQAQADIKSDARERLQEIRDEIALLEAEMADLEEVIDG